jgi:pilus assembly protein CpaC
MKAIICGLLGGLAIGLAIAMPGREAAAQARIEEGPSGGSALARRITMGVGKSIIVDLPRDASEIFVGNPKVANAVVRSTRKLYIIGMENGQTSVYALDQQGRQIAMLEISIGRDIGELQQILKAAMPTSSISARTVNDTIILTGSVESAQQAQRAWDIAQGFVKRANNGSAGTTDGMVVNSLVIRGRDQVMLKVTVAEIRRDIAKQLGLTSSTLSGTWGTFTQFNPFGINGVLAQSASGTATALTLQNPSNSLNGTLQAFERYGVSRILAEPTVTAVSGEAAKFTAGGEFPIPGPAAACLSTSNTASTSVCSGGAIYKPFGVTLNFEPVVLSEGRILLRIATEVTEIDSSRSVTIQGTTVPSLRTRKNETTVELPSGGSIASAGLLQTTSQQVINGLPGLMNLPILGTLFRSRDYQRQETELIIVVTPYVAKATAANELVRPDDGFAEASDPQTWLLGRVNRLYATPNNPQAVQNYRGRVGFIQD